MDEKSLWAALGALPLAGIRFYPETGSTNDEALRWQAAGAGDGSVVVAESQTAGRGRLNRPWETPPGAALAFSLVILPTAEEARRSALFSPLGALAVADALQRCYQLAAEVKWPNDVLIQRRKVCGVLGEASWQGSTLQAVVLGIGVNVAPDSVPPPERLMFPATCVEQALGKPVDKHELLRAALEQVFAWRKRLLRDDFIRAWDERLAFKGEWVQVLQPNQPPLEGRLLGITADGNLRLQTTADEAVSVVAGDVSLRPSKVEQFHTPGG